MVVGVDEVAVAVEPETAVESAAAAQGDMGWARHDASLGRATCHDAWGQDLEVGDQQALEAQVH